MSAYCDPEDLPTYGVNEDAIEEIPEPRMTAAIEGGASLIESYATSWSLPLVSWGNDIRRANAIIAAYDLISSRGYSPQDENNKDPLRTRYEDVIKWLEKISEGTVTPAVVDSSGGAGTGATGGADDVSAFGATVTSNQQRGWYDGEAGNPYRGPFVGGR